MRDPTEVFAELSKSKFRSGCHLNEKDRAYFVRRGMDVVLEHAADFIETRLAPAAPAKDGRQTPWRGHPSSLLSTPLPPVAVGACRNGTGFRKAGR